MNYLSAKDKPLIDLTKSEMEDLERRIESLETEVLTRVQTLQDMVEALLIGGAK